MAAAASPRAALHPFRVRILPRCQPFLLKSGSWSEKAAVVIGVPFPVHLAQPALDELRQLLHSSWEDTTPRCLMQQISERLAKLAPSVCSAIHCEPGPPSSSATVLRLAFSVASKPPLLMETLDPRTP
jgi:hypothetical protein